MQAKEPQLDPDPLVDEYFKSLAAGELRVQYCTRDEEYSFPPLPACRVCQRADRLEMREVSGNGRIYSWTVVHRSLDPHFVDDVPYGIVVVDLDEGPRLFGRWNPEHELVPGARVSATFDPARLGYLAFEPSQPGEGR